MNYESTFICSPEMSAEKVEELTGKVLKIVETANGAVKTVQQLGKKRLAYPINKFREGNYVYIELSGSGEMISAVESFFKLNDGVIRYLTVKAGKKKAAAKAEPKAPEVPASPEVNKDEPATQQPSLA